MEAPDEILKPYVFVPKKEQISFPSNVKHQNHKPPRRRPPHPNSFHRQTPAGSQRSQNRLQRPNEFNDHFGNTLGPDFGPVTFEDIAPIDNDDFGNAIDSFKKKPFTPSIPVPSIPPRRPPPRNPVRGPPPRPSSGFSHNSGGGFGNFHLGGGSCKKYTDDICLDVANYPQ